MQTRNYKMDNIRFIMIMCVLIGHFIELYNGEIVSKLYRLIYSFHMPVLIFISGYFAKYSRRRLFFTYVYSYIVFQVLYLAFDSIILKGQKEITFQFTTPYWLLWYLFVMILFYFCLPVLEKTDFRTSIIMLCVCGILSIIMGFDNSLGYYLSLMRFFTFLPYFALGFLGRKFSKEFSVIERTKEKVGLLIVLGGLLLVFCSYLIRNTDITRQILYGSYTYLDFEYSPILKSFLLMFGLVWIAFLLLVTPNIKIPFVTIFGQHTFPVFLLHGFIVKLSAKYAIFCYSEKKNLLLTLIMSYCILVLFGNQFFAKVFDYIFTGKLLDKMWCRMNQDMSVVKSVDYVQIQRRKY